MGTRAKVIYQANTYRYMYRGKKSFIAAATLKEKYLTNQMYKYPHRDNVRQ